MGWRIGNAHGSVGRLGGVCRAAAQRRLQYHYHHTPLRTSHWSLAHVTITPSLSPSLHCHDILYYTLPSLLALSSFITGRKDVIPRLSPLLPRHTLLHYRYESMAKCYHYTPLIAYFAFHYSFSSFVTRKVIAAITPPLVANMANGDTIGHHCRFSRHTLLSQRE